MRLLKQSTAYNAVVFMTDSSDHVTGKTGLTLTITASKAAGSFASISPTVTELATGWYKLALDTTMTNTLGDFALHITATGADPTDVIMQIVSFDTQDAVRMGLTALPNAAAEASGGLYTRGTGAGQINQDANGRIDANVKTWIGGAIPAVNVTGVPLVDAKYLLGTIFATPNTAGVPLVDVSKWLGTTVATPTVAGIPKAEVSSIAAGAITATAIATDAITAAKVADGTIDAATFASGAINAAAIATDALGALELAAGAATEIADALLATVIDANAPANMQTVKQHLTLTAAALMAPTGDSLEGSTPTIRDLGNTKNRIVLGYSGGDRTLTSGDGS